MPADRPTFHPGDDSRLAIAQDEPALEVAPTSAPATPSEWVRQNLFSSWLNGALTVVSGAFLVFVVYRAFNFVFATAEWQVVREFMKGYMVGPFPIEEVWRLWICAYLVAVLAGVSLGASRWRPIVTGRRAAVTAAIVALAMLILLFTTQTWLVRLLAVGLVFGVGTSTALGRVLGTLTRKPLIVAWLLLFPVMLLIIRGFGGVPPQDWGGLFFNLIAATVGIVASFPIGILLALGRRSELPAVRVVSVVVIEVFRGVPLVAWLIFSKFVVDLLLPPQMSVPDIIKAFIAMTMFSAAYVGEIVRGGLQGVPSGQYEAARALGLSPTRLMVLIVLPQALRTTIPAMISHFISLFKDTSLFSAIQVTDLLAAARRSASSLEFFGRDAETLLFAALVFWAIAFSMARWSQRLELRLGVGER
jgi:general L-amino acid transport system permease protein